MHQVNNENPSNTRAKEMMRLVAEFGAAEFALGQDVGLERRSVDSELRVSQAREQLYSAINATMAEPAPIDMVLHCPACGKQHIDAPECGPLMFDQMQDAPKVWDNPPHRSHKCHGCGHIWRPADVPTNGVCAVNTKGKNDSPIATPVAINKAAQQAAIDLAGRLTELAACAPHLQRVQLANGLQEAAAFIRNIAINRHD
jgi:hypothetical protein